MKTLKKIGEFFTKKRCSALGLLAGSSLLSASSAIAADKPNFVFILADDLGWTDINCRLDNGDPTLGGEYDGTYHETPRIAELRAKGMRFTSACVWPFCAPTRIAIMTGKYPAKLAFTDLPGEALSEKGGRRSFQGGTITQAFFRRQMPLEETTIAEALKPNLINPGDPDNYVSCIVGKWHLCSGYSSQNIDAYQPDAPEHGFDFAVGYHSYRVKIKSLNRKEYFEAYWEHKGNDNQRWELYAGMAGDYDPETLWGNPNESTEEYLTDSYTTKALQFLDRVGNPDDSLYGRPFFLYLSHVAPHSPLKRGGVEQAHKDYTNYFENKDSSKSRNEAIYAAQIKSLDDSVGSIIDKIEELENDGHIEPDNTVIIFTSDNGGGEGPAENDPLRGQKSEIYEGGIRVPLIIWWPGVTDPYSTCDVPVHCVDFFPTILEMARIDNPVSGIDGQSLVPLLKGEPFTRENSAIFWHYPARSSKGVHAPCHVVRKDNYKLIKFYDYYEHEGQSYTWQDHFDQETGQLRLDAPATFKLYDLGPGGRIDSALKFDGSNDYVDIGNKLNDVSIPFSVTAWVKENNSSKQPIFISDDSTGYYGFWFYISSLNKLNIVYGNGNDYRLKRSENEIPNDDDWHFVAAVVKGKNDIVLYIDGDKSLQEGFGGDAEDMVHDESNVLIGKISRYSSHFKGYIDDLRVYNRALSADDVNDLANLRTSSGTGPVAYWRLDETYGNTAHDSADVHHGTLNGDMDWNLDDMENLAEEANLYDHPDYKDIREELEDLLVDWLDEVDAKMPMPRARIGNQFYASIQDAINGANSNDTIIICPGVHCEGPITINKANVTLSSFDPDDSEIVAATIIRPPMDKRYTDQREDRKRVIEISANNCTLTGLTISNGYLPSGDGAGIYCSNNVFGTTVSKCIIRENYAAGNGGGIYGVDGTISNCIIIQNSASGNGGGLAGCLGTISNCLVYANSASEHGGGMSNYSSSPTLANCTFSRNSAEFGGGMSNYRSSPTVTNCIFWSDSAPTGPEIALRSTDYPSTLTISYSDVQGGQTDVYVESGCTLNWGAGNINAAPLFIGPNGLNGIHGTADDEEHNVHLLPTISPCINAGDPSGDYTGQVDLDGQPRVAYGRVDMGADEVFPIAGDFEPDGDLDLVDFAIFANNWLLGVE